MATDASDEAILGVHERYIREVVEELGLCPFARRCREQGRLHRPLFRVDPGGDQAGPVAATLAEIATEHPSAEIVLATFVDPNGQFDAPPAFEAFVARVRKAYSALPAPLFFMVAFHPRLAETIDPSRPLTQSTLVPLIRRTPEPVIQCVHAGVLEQARQAAQAAAHRKRLEAHGHDPVIRAMLERSVQTDSELSADIARSNFDRYGRAEGRAELERRIQAIARARSELGR